MKARILEILMFVGILPWITGLYACMPSAGGSSNGLMGCGSPKSSAMTCGPSVPCPSGKTCNYSTSPAMCQ